MKRPQESRREKRLAVDIEAKVSIVPAKDDAPSAPEGANPQQIAVRTRDISRSGICLISRVPIPRDTLLDVQLVLAFGPNARSEPLAVLGRTTWCTALFGQFQLGVMFVGMDAQRRHYLELFLRFLDGELGGGNYDDDDAGARRDSLDPDNPRGEDKDDPFRR